MAANEKGLIICWWGDAQSANCLLGRHDKGDFKKVQVKTGIKNSEYFMEFEEMAILP